MFNLPWIEKYRPKNMDEIIDHQLKIQTLRNLMHRNELTHLLFYGAPGLGKTSLALSLARELYGDDYRMYILELNASDERGIDVVRNKIPHFIQSRSDRIKMVILDEADAMTSEAQNAIRRVMENAIRTSRFVLICNNIKKIIPELQSRCVKMRFAPLDGVRVNVFEIDGYAHTNSEFFLYGNHFGEGNEEIVKRIEIIERSDKKFITGSFRPLDGKFELLTFFEN